MKFKQNRLFFLITCFWLQSTLGQFNDNWYFGNGSGLKFTNQNTAVIEGPLYTNEGCASVSDHDGNLLFYTNGIEVFDAKGNIMPGGNSLGGHKSATQSALIVPFPTDPLRYYVFTLTEKGGYNGLRYSIVDLSKRRGEKNPGSLKSGALVTPDLDQTVGLGEVTLINKPLLKPVSEKLICVPADDGKSLWVICHKWGNNAFYAFPITSSGVGRPVVSKIGAYQISKGNSLNNEAIGCLKASHDFKTLASVTTYKKNSPIELFDFNNITGRISNFRQIPTSGFAYGLEFSPNNQYLYVSFIGGNVGLMQYDITHSDVFDSQIQLQRRTDVSADFGQLQLGPDQRIYMARVSKYLDVIQYPDKKGSACGYKEKAIKLLKTSTYGLPQKVYNLNKPLQEQLITSHEADSQEISTDNKSKKTNPAEKNKYTKIKIEENFEVDLGEDRTVCGSSYILDAGIHGARYKWSTGEQTKKITVRNGGVYWLEVSLKSQKKYDTVRISFTNQSLDLDLEDVNVQCKDSVVLDAIIKDAEYVWSTEETTKNIVVKQSDYYSVTVSKDGCTASDKIYVDFESKPTRFDYLKEFKPGNSVINNYFAYSINDVKTFNMKIQKGNKVIFETDNPKEKWFGHKGNNKSFVKAGTYDWEINYTPECGEAASKKGEVKVLR